MDEKYEQGVLWISTVCLVAAGLLILLGSVGVAPSLPVVLGLVFLTGIAFAALNQYPLPERYLDEAWVGVAVAALVALLGLGQSWTAGETQTVGGIVGMVGVVNLFLRPVYRLCYHVVDTLTPTGGESDERSS